MSFVINADQLKDFKQDYANRQETRILERTVAKNGVKAASFDWHAIADNDQHFSIDLATGDVADQKQSGRCWLFAALNTMRHNMQNRFNLPDFVRSPLSGRTPAIEEKIIFRKVLGSQ